MSEIRKTVKIPSCRINKDTLLEVCDLLDSELQSMKKIDEKEIITYKIKINSKDKQIIENSSEGIRTLKIPKNLMEIKIELYAFGKISRDIDITLDFSSFWQDSKIQVSGNDDIWVNGLSGRLVSIFEEEKTHNHIFSERKTAFPIIIALSIVTSFAVHFAEYLISGSNEELSIKAESIASIAFIVMWGWYWLLIWLFPKIEFEDFALASRIRKKIMSALGIIIGGIIVNGIYEFLK